MRRHCDRIAPQNNADVIYPARSTEEEKNNVSRKTDERDTADLKNGAATLRG